MHTQGAYDQRGQPATAADVEHAIINGVCITSGGPSQDITHPTWTSTPQLAIIFVTKCTTAWTLADDAMVSVCLCDGTNTESVSSLSLDNLSTTNAQRLSSQANLVLGEDATVDYDGVASVTLISGGVRLTWSTLPLAAYLVRVLAFAGSSCNAKVGQLRTSSTQDDYVSITHASNVRSDLVLIFGNEAQGSEQLNPFLKDFGVFVGGPSGGQFACALSDANGVTTTASSAEIRNDSAVYSVGNGEYSRGEVEQTGDGFRVYTRGNTNAEDYKYVSFNFTKATGAGLDLKCNGYAYPASGGTDSVSGVGFTPTLLVMAATAATAQNTTYTTSPDCECIGYGFADGSAQSALSVSVEDAVTTSNTASVVSNQIVDVYQQGGTTAVAQANLDSFDADGFTLDFTTTSSGREAWYLAIGGTTAPPRVGHDYLTSFPRRRVQNALGIR